MYYLCKKLLKLDVKLENNDFHLVGICSMIISDKIINRDSIRS